MCRTTTTRWLAGLAGSSVLLLASGAIAQSDPVSQVNAFYRTIANAKRSDLRVLPEVAKLQAPPASVATLEQARLTFAGSSGWASAAEWAKAPEQQAVLAALAEVTQETDWQAAWGFGQPYGVEGVSSELIAAGLYTELGDPPTLAAASIGYLPPLERVAILVNVEATRRASDGNPRAAVDLLCDWVLFCRQIVDREMYAESSWAMEQMTLGIERVRDVAYVDWREGQKLLTGEDLKAVIDRLDPEKGVLGLDRIKLPRGDQIAAEQVIARTFVERDGINAGTFATTMAKLGSRERPLQLFSEASKWQAMASLHADWFDTTDGLKKVHGDWQARWQLSPFDNRNKLPSELSKADPARLAVLHALTADQGTLFESRQVMRAEAVGTRWALGLLGFHSRNQSMPPSIRAISPGWIPKIEADPFNPDRARGQVPPLQFFVPIRDTKDQFGPKEEPRPHRMNIITGQLNFDVSIGQDQWIVYSVGTDLQKNWVRVVRNTGAYAPNADYLIWPPVLSLTRQHQRDLGVLK